MKNSVVTLKALLTSTREREVMNTFDVTHICKQAFISELEISNY